jgi:hypothetical protein
MTWESCFDKVEFRIIIVWDIIFKAAGLGKDHIKTLIEALPTTSQSLPSLWQFMGIANESKQGAIQIRELKILTRKMVLQ